MNTTQAETDVIRRRFPDPEPRRGLQLLRRLRAVTVEPVQNDRRLLVYPIAVVMAVGIGLLGHALGPDDGASAAADVTVSSFAPTAVTDRDASTVHNLSDHAFDGDTAAPSPRTR